MSLSRPILPLMAAARPGLASISSLALRRIAHRPTPSTPTSCPAARHTTTASTHRHLSPSSLHCHHHTPHRTLHTHHRNILPTTKITRLSSSPPRPRTSLSSLPHHTAVQPHRPITQLVVVGVLVLSGWFIRKKYLEMRAMRPDLQSEPLDPSSSNVQYHEGGFAEKMDRTEAALILGVRDNASKEKIMERYRQLMKVNHPDLGGSPYVSTKINEAKELLSKTARSETEGVDRKGRKWQKI